ncbi:uncharacterized protein RSE6_11815 [Rhynchosporium secalis]|uniref:SHSP domain-containing protein n=1 Tax=Rhynchosporium secalis TaxID=38038 RepID=A0A1E1MNU2_RHYSE|nr:uncharacterized protein RSE6_11815 [Rhynchosporium secalis]
MPFFPQEFLPEAALMQLLAELDQSELSKAQPQVYPSLQNSQRQQHPCIRLVHRPAPQTFTPRFDVTETADSYELFGELPGLENADLDIQFVDAQTIVIKGKTERSVSTSRSAPSESAKEVEQTQETATEPDENEKSSLAATVEDDYDEADIPLDTPSSAASTASLVAKGKQPEKTASSSSSTLNHETQTQSPRQAKYWVSERKVGNFARSFAFEQRIEQDFVTAGLKNGVLNVVVPKSVRSKKVVVSVL